MSGNKDAAQYLNRRGQILQEFDNFCEQFERRAAESFANPEVNNDDKFKIFDSGSEDRSNATGDTDQGQ